MAERVFAKKLERVGFREIWFGEKFPFGINEAALFPLFTPGIIAMMSNLIPPERQDRVAIGVIAKATKPK